MKYTIEVLDASKPVGVDEDGQVQYAPRYYLLLTNRAGRCWQSTTYWDATIEETEDGPIMDVAAAKANAEWAAAVALQMLESGRRLNPHCWDEVQPIYGSPIWEREVHLWETTPEE